MPEYSTYQNIMMNVNVINSVYKNKVNRLLILEITCIYSEVVEQRMRSTHYCV
jgi:hypothetical protein